MPDHLKTISDGREHRSYGRVVGKSDGHAINGSESHIFVIKIVCMVVTKPNN